MLAFAIIITAVSAFLFGREWQRTEDLHNRFKMRRRMYLDKEGEIHIVLEGEVIETNN